MAAVANFAALENKKAELIRKGLAGAMFMADVSAAAITTITEALIAARPLALPDAAWGDVGYMTTDGISLANSIESTDTNSWGSNAPTRSDITGSTSTMAFTAQETNLKTIELLTGTDLSAFTPPTSGELSVAMPDRPTSRYFRAMAMAVDDGDDGEIYIATFFPRAKVTTFGDQAYANSEIVYPVTLTGYRDSTLGYSRKLFWGGPGWLALLTEMGF
jgi:hypothetical protein